MMEVEHFSLEPWNEHIFHTFYDVDLHPLLTWTPSGNVAWDKICTITLTDRLNISEESTSEAKFE